MTVTSIQRDWGEDPSIVRMVTDSFIEDIVQPGWLATQQASIDQVNQGGFTWNETDVILLSYPLDQNDPTGQQGKVFVYPFPDFLSINPMSPIYPNLQNIVAHAGGGQTNATQLNIGIDVVVTVATGGDSTKLPADVQGQTVVVVNKGANAMDVFPSLGDSINALSANTAFSVASGTVAMFIGVTPTNWVVIQ